ncbi:MAG TPA: hypothetical protein VGR37_24080 [Longimicrobiaceae bacterium]|nr:hypothetical protein [Longimicrobiaceae bacterium]
MTPFRVVRLAAVLSLAACELNPIGDVQPSYMLATVDGALEKQYEGTGEFHTGTPGPGRKQFQVTSQGQGASANQSFTLTRWDGGRLGRGTHPITLVDDAGFRGQMRGITVQFATREGNQEQRFVAESGELEITSSSETLVEGRFRFTGFRYCAREVVRSNPPVPPVGPCTPLLAAPVPDAPKITVSGSFVTKPLEVTGGIREPGR